MNKIRNRLKTLPATISDGHKANPNLFWVRVLYIAALVYVVVFWRAIWTPDLLFLMLLGVFFLYGLGRQFMFQFGPFIFLLLAYDSLRSIAPFLNHRVHFTEMIDFDRWLTGGILPTTALQNWWWQGHLSWYDIYFYTLYMLHFVVPLTVGILIWRLRSAHFNRFVVAFLTLSYAGFITYILFPAAPPWMASEMGLIPALHKISTDVWWSVGVHDYPSIYRTLSPNLVAAVPSLHAAYPTLISMFVWRAFGWRWGVATLWYPISMWIGIIYMGEHYVVDALLGIAYAVTAYVLTMWLFRRYGAHARTLQGHAKRHWHRHFGDRRASATD